MSVVNVLQTRIEALCQQVGPHAGPPYGATNVPRLALGALSEPTSGVATVFEPVACLILRGAKEVTIGQTVLRYDTAHYFVASLDLPAMGRVVEASADSPYLGAGLTLDRSLLADLIASMPPDMIGSQGAAAERSGFSISPVTPDLLEAWAGLLALLGQPDDVALLAPLREREILYRLLRGPLGGQLCQIAQEDSRLSRVRRVIAWMRAHYDQGLHTAELAEIAGMSVPSFHRHFKAATAMSPLQYQKALRLHAARRLLASGTEVSGAAYAVGYESASQFSREYSRAFGLPPSRDV